MTTNSKTEVTAEDAAWFEGDSESGPRTFRPEYVDDLPLMVWPDDDEAEQARDAANLAMVRADQAKWLTADQAAECRRILGITSVTP